MPGTGPPGGGGQQRWRLGPVGWRAQTYHARGCEIYFFKKKKKIKTIKIVGSWKRQGCRRQADLEISFRLLEERLTMLQALDLAPVRRGILPQEKKREGFAGAKRPRQAGRGLACAAAKRFSGLFFLFVILFFLFFAVTKLCETVDFCDQQRRNPFFFFFFFC